MRAVQISRFGGPEVLDVVNIPEPEAGPNQKVHDVSTAGFNYADTHQLMSSEPPQRLRQGDVRAGTRRR